VAAVSKATRTTASPVPQVTDANGETCSSFDSTGYCPGDDPLTCTTVLDPTGWNNGPLNEERAIGVLSATLIADGTAILTGNASNSDLRLLDEVALDMKNQSGDQLATDSSQFAEDEDSYNPGQTDFGPEDTSYSEALEKDVLTLVKDCPHAYKLGQQMLNGG
jgi:hypothetical protein